MPTIARRLSIGLFALSLAATAGCVNMNSLTGARAVGVDRWEIAVSVSLVPLFEESDWKLVGVPMIDIAARFGVAEWADVGLRFSSGNFFMVDAKFEAFDDTDATIAFKPGFGVNLVELFGRGEPIFQVEVPVLADVHISSESTLTVAPKYVVIIDQYANADHFMGAEVHGSILLDRGVATDTNRLRPSGAFDGHYVRAMPFVSLLARLGDERRFQNDNDLLGSFGLGIIYGDGL